MQKLSNSSIFDKIAEIIKPQPETKPLNSFAEQLQKIASTPKRTLRDILAQVDPVPPLPSDEVVPPPVGGNIPEAGLDEGAPIEPDLEQPSENEDVKKHLCEALVSLCGSVEQAHQCLDKCNPPEASSEIGIEESGEIPGIEDNLTESGTNFGRCPRNGRQWQGGDQPVVDNLPKPMMMPM